MKRFTVRTIIPCCLLTLIISLFPTFAASYSDCTNPDGQACPQACSSMTNELAAEYSTHVGACGTATDYICYYDVYEANAGEYCFRDPVPAT